MELREAEKITELLTQVRECDRWIGGLNMQDVAHSRSVFGFMSMEEAHLGISEEAALAIRKIVRAEMESRRSVAENELRQIGVKI